MESVEPWSPLPLWIRYVALRHKAPLAGYLLGRLYESGMGAPCCGDAAQRWYRAALDTSYRPFAAWRLWVMTNDPSWIRVAHDAGHGPATALLAEQTLPLDVDAELPKGFRRRPNRDRCIGYLRQRGETPRALYLLSKLDTDIPLSKSVDLGYPPAQFDAILLRLPSLTRKALRDAVCSFDVCSWSTFHAVDASSIATLLIDLAETSSYRLAIRALLCMAPRDDPEHVRRLERKFPHDLDVQLVRHVYLTEPHGQNQSVLKELADKGSYGAHRALGIRFALKRDVIGAEPHLAWCYEQNPTDIEVVYHYAQTLIHPLKQIEVWRRGLSLLDSIPVDHVLYVEAMRMAGASLESDFPIDAKRYYLKSFDAGYIPAGLSALSLSTQTVGETTSLRLRIIAKLEPIVHTNPAHVHGEVLRRLYQDCVYRLSDLELDLERLTASRRLDMTLQLIQRWDDDEAALMLVRRSSSYTVPPHCDAMEPWHTLSAPEVDTYLQRAAKHHTDAMYDYAVWMDRDTRNPKASHVTIAAQYKAFVEELVVDDFDDPRAVYSMERILVRLGEAEPEPKTKTLFHQLEHPLMHVYKQWISQKLPTGADDAWRFHILAARLYQRFHLPVQAANHYDTVVNRLSVSSAKDREALVFLGEWMEGKGVRYGVRRRRDLAMEYFVRASALESEDDPVSGPFRTLSEDRIFAAEAANGITQVLQFKECRKRARSQAARREQGKELERIEEMREKACKIRKTLGMTSIKDPAPDTEETVVTNVDGKDVLLVKKMVPMLTCIVCEASARTVAFQPCGHALCCDACSTKLLAMKSQCFVCKTAVTTCATVYL